MTEDPPKRKPGRPRKKPAPSGEKPNLTEKQWLGLEREFRGCDKEWRKDGWPSSTSARLVAEAAGVSPRAVQMWRKDSEYRRGLGWLADQKISQINQKIAEKLTQKLKNGDQDQTRPPLGRMCNAALCYHWRAVIQAQIPKPPAEPPPEPIPGVPPIRPPEKPPKPPPPLHAPH